MTFSRNELQSTVARLFLASTLIIGLLGLTAGPVTHAAEGDVIGAPSDAPPPPTIAPVPAMLPPQAPQRDPTAPPPPPSLERNRRNEPAPVVDHFAARFEPPTPEALEGLMSEDTPKSKVTLGIKTSAPTTLPNLALYQPYGWDGPVVLSTQPGTNSNDMLYEGSDVYVDWAVGNDGASTPANFITCVYIDNMPAACWSANGLNGGYYTGVLDWLIDQPLSAGWHLIGLWTDVYDSVAESDEEDNYGSEWYYWYPAGNSLNLMPYVPEGWDDPVVPASEVGPSGDLRLYADAPTYFDTAFANYGTQASASFTSCLYVDNVEKYCDRIALNANYYMFYEDHPVTISGSGWHVVELRVDVLNEVAEANETDNVWSASFYWEGSSQPNLHPYQPDGWDDAIVASSQAGTHTSDPLLAGSPAYVDWSFVNDGWNDISSAFDLQLYVDGVLNQTWTVPDGLPSGYYVSFEDYAITLPAGSHTLEMRADTSNTVAESDETDNTHMAEFFWNQSGGTPEIDVQPSQLNIRVTAQGADAYAPVTLSRTGASSHAADIRTRGLGLMLTPPTLGVYPPVPLAAQSSAHRPNVDLSGGLPPVGHQGSASSCVGWSSSYYYKTFQERVDHGWDVTLLTHRFSPNFVWNQGQASATGPCDGMWPGNATQIMTDRGDVPLSSLPYTEDCRQAITPAQLDEATSYRAQDYGPFFRNGAVTNGILDQMKAWLSEGDPILIGIEMPPEFNNPAGANCIVDLPTQGASRGLHAITIVGFDDDAPYAGGAFKIVNSWGTGWGCGGFAWLTYRWFEDHALEAWWMRDIRTGGNASRDFTISNVGTRSLTVTSVTGHSTPVTWLDIVPPAAITPGHPLVIQPGQSATIEVNVHPEGLANQTYTGSIEIASDDPTDPVKVVGVQLEVGAPAGAPPPPVGNLAPPNGATNQPPSGVTVQWQSAGPNMVYDVRMDTNNPPSQIRCNDVSATNCVVGNLGSNTTYFWRVVAADGLNVSLGPIWSFTTGGGSALNRRVYLPVIQE